MNRLIRSAVAGVVGLLWAAGAQAQGWYNYTLPSLDSAAQPAKPIISNSYSGYYLGPGGEFYSGSVNTYTANLGSGVSMEWFTSVLNGPAGGLPWATQSAFGPAFAAAPGSNYANSIYSGPGMGVVNTGGRVSFDLGGGLSMDFLGAMSRAPGYYAPGTGFDSRMSTTVGTGFTMNFGHGGSLSFVGSMSRGFGAGFATCGPIFAACR